MEGSTDLHGLARTDTDAPLDARIAELESQLAGMRLRDAVERRFVDEAEWDELADDGPFYVVEWDGEHFYALRDRHNCVHRVHKSHCWMVMLARALNVYLSGCKASAYDAELAAAGKVESGPGADTDPVERPAHYRAEGLGVECIDVIEALGLGFRLANCMKYLWRAGRKGGRLEDLRKARWYLDREIGVLEKDVPLNPPSKGDGEGDFRPAESFAPGDYLSEELAARGWALEYFAHRIGVPMDVLRDVLEGRAGLDDELAERIGAAFGTGSEVWRNIEASWQAGKKE